jgi:hypothetical protein
MQKPMLMTMNLALCMAALTPPLAAASGPPLSPLRGERGIGLATRDSR